MKFIMLYEDFANDNGYLLNNDFLVEEHWLKYVPEEIKINKDGRKGVYKIKKPCKNSDSVNIYYELTESDSALLPTILILHISFKIKNEPDSPMFNNSIECIFEVTVGNLYVIGIKFTKNSKEKFIENKTWKMDDKASRKIVKLINYISNNKLKVKSLK